MKHTLKRSERKRMRVYDSKCGEDKMRGTAIQIADKYADKAEEARKEKDEVLRETCLQHEHHYRTLHEAERAGNLKAVLDD